MNVVNDINQQERPHASRFVTVHVEMFRNIWNVRPPLGNAIQHIEKNKYTACESSVSEVTIYWNKQPILRNHNRLGSAINVI